MFVYLEQEGIFAQKQEKLAFAGGARMSAASSCLTCKMLYEQSKYEGACTGRGRCRTSYTLLFVAPFVGTHEAL